MAYVYSHFTEDEKKLFYIGISNISDGKYIRAIDKNKRSKFWKSIVKKHGFYHEIIKDNITWDEAIVLEIELIAKYGRLHDNSGLLCNLTTGGEGCIGFPITQEYRDNCSKAQKGKIGKFGAENPFFGRKHTKESMAKRLATLKENGTLKSGPAHHSYGKKISEEQRQLLIKINTGKKLSEAHKQAISKGGKGILKTEDWKRKHSGTNNVQFIDFAPIETVIELHTKQKLSTIKIGKMFGVSHGTVYKRLIDAGIEVLGQSERRKSVICINDGVIFKSMYAAGKFYGIANSSIYNVIIGKFKQIKGLKFKQI